MSITFKNENYTVVENLHNFSVFQKKKKTKIRYSKDMPPTRDTFFII